MSQIPTVEDRRCVSWPDTPFSAYCAVCWRPVYWIWVDRENYHGGRCPEGADKMIECGEAMNSAREGVAVRRWLAEVKR